MAEMFTDGTAAGPCAPVGQRRCLHVHRLRARSEAFNDIGPETACGFEGLGVHRPGGPRSLVTTPAEMLALTAGDLQGVGSAVVAGNTGRSHSGA
jgi:hypothetical protein